MVVLIPTKERAYCPFLKETGERLPGTFATLCDAEERIKEELVQFLASMKIAYVDVSPAMEGQIREHVQIYPPDTDGHPQATGHAVIARAVYEAVRRQRPPR